MRSFVRNGILALAVALFVSLAACDMGPAKPSYSNLTETQRLEDSRLLLATVRDECFSLAVKGRVEGYDWASHEQESEAAVGLAKSDEEFAKAMNSMLLFA